MHRHLLQGHWLFLDPGWIALRLREDPSDRKSPSTPPSSSCILGPKPDWLSTGRWFGPVCRQRSERGKPSWTGEPSSFQLRMTSSPHWSRCAHRTHQPCVTWIYHHTQWTQTHTASLFITLLVHNMLSEQIVVDDYTFGYLASRAWRYLCTRFL